MHAKIFVSEKFILKEKERWEDFILIVYIDEYINKISDAYFLKTTFSKLVETLVIFNQLILFSFFN